MRYNQSSNSASTCDWESLFSEPFRALEPFFRPALNSSFRPSPNRQVEWYEDKENYFSLVELPGVKRENLDIDMEDGLLRLSYSLATKPAEKKASEERRYELVLRAPDGVEIQKTSAKLEDGILKLTFPKSEVKKPLRIEIG